MKITPRFWLAETVLSLADFIARVGWHLLGWRNDDFSDDYEDGDDFCGDDFAGHCLTCGAQLELVRPGKWQCPNEGMPEHDKPKRTACNYKECLFGSAFAFWDNESDDDAFNNL